MDFLKQTLNILFDLVLTLIFLRVILSWFMQEESSALMRFLVQSTDPILKPIRRLLPRLGYLDLSPLIAIFLLEAIRNLINVYL